MAHDDYCWDDVCDAYAEDFEAGRQDAIFSMNLDEIEDDLESISGELSSIAEDLRNLDSESELKGERFEELMSFLDNVIEDIDKAARAAGGC